MGRAPRALVALVDDTPGHGSPVYLLVSAQRVRAFIKLIGEMVQSGKMDRSGELTFIAAVVTRFDQYKQVFGGAVPEELSLAWGRH